MTEISEFVEARLAERAAEAHLIHALGCDAHSPCPDGCCPMGTCDCGEPERILADVTIKRYLIGEYKLAVAFDAGAATENALNERDEDARLLKLAEAAAGEAAKNVLLGVVKAFASADAFHSDYDPAWSLWPHVRVLAEHPDPTTRPGA